MELSSRRAALGLSQRELAARIGLRSIGHLSEIETGACQPSLRVAARIWRETGVKLGPLSGVTDEEAATAAKLTERAS